MKRCASVISDMSCIIDIEPPPGSTVRFISDLHLGHERCEAPAVAGLAPLLQGIGTLVILGDAAETRKCSWQEAGLAAREELRSLCRKHGVQLVEIAGNHDPDLPALLVRLWSGRVIGMHGHALYKEGAPWSWEYLHNKQACRQLISSFAQVDTNLEQRLELSRQMCQLTPPVMRREGIRNPLLLLHPLQFPEAEVFKGLFMGKIVGEDEPSPILQSPVQPAVQAGLLRLGKMVQGFHGHRSVKAVCPQGNRKIGALNQRQLLPGKFPPKGSQHPLRQVDSGHCGTGISPEVVFQLQTGSAPQIQHGASRCFRKAGGSEGVKLRRSFNIGQHMLIIALQAGFKERIHSFQHRSFLRQNSHQTAFQNLHSGVIQ